MVANPWQNDVVVVAARRRPDTATKCVNRMMLLRRWR